MGTGGAGNCRVFRKVWSANVHSTPLDIVEVLGRFVPVTEYEPKNLDLLDILFDMVKGLESGTVVVRYKVKVDEAQGLPLKSDVDSMGEVVDFLA